MTSPRPSKRLHTLARRARTAPGVGVLTSLILSRLRRNRVLTDLVWRVFDSGRGAGRSTFPLHPGQYLGGLDVDRLPIVGVVATGLSHDEADQLLDQVAELQRRLKSFRPLIVLDRPNFATARRHGYVLEVVTPAAAWPGDLTTWTTYVGSRVASVIEHYRLWTVLMPTEGRLTPMDIAILESLHEFFPDDLDVGGTAVSVQPGAGTE